MTGPAHGQGTCPRLEEEQPETAKTKQRTAAAQMASREVEEDGWKHARRKAAARRTTAAAATVETASTWPEDGIGEEKKESPKTSPAASGGKLEGKWPGMINGREEEEFGSHTAVTARSAAAAEAATATAEAREEAPTRKRRAWKSLVTRKVAPGIPQRNAGWKEEFVSHAAVTARSAAAAEAATATAEAREEAPTRKRRAWKSLVTRKVAPGIPSWNAGRKVMWKLLARQPA